MRLVEIGRYYERMIIPCAHTPTAITRARVKVKVQIKVGERACVLETERAQGWIHKANAKQ